MVSDTESSHLMKGQYHLRADLHLSTFSRQNHQFLELTRGKKPLRKMAVCMKFRFILANTGEQNGCSSGTRSDK